MYFQKNNGKIVNALQTCPFFHTQISGAGILSLILSAFHFKLLAKVHLFSFPNKYRHVV
jgi:hypothetical protein